MMMRSALVLLLAASALAQYTITDAGQDDGPPSSHSGVSQQKQGNNDRPIQYAPPMPSVHPDVSQQKQVNDDSPIKQETPSEASSTSHQSPALQQKQVNGGSLSALLGGSAAAQPMAPRASPQPPSMAMHSRGRNDDFDLSQDSMQVVRGLVEAFMHKEQLMPGEKRCLETNIGTFAGDIMGAVDDIVTASKALIKGKGSIAKGQSRGVMAAGMDGGMKLMSLVTLSTSVLKNCFHGDALELMKKTGQHMINGTYLEHRILVNGVDIARSLSDAILAFEAHHFHRFGTDIGISLRKILLSKATGGSRPLPEGVPEQVIIQKATEGLMDGFFARGSSLEITDTANPDVDIVVNLHQCVAGNSMFFKGIWMAAWDLFAQMSVNKEQHGLGSLGLDQDLPVGQMQGEPKWQGELMAAMVQIPMALQRCGVSQEMQEMLMEAIKSLKGLHADFHIPNHHVSGREAATRMAKAVEAWTRWDFERFGYELGKLFRELVMLAFPQKYSTDASGRLWLASQTSSAKETGTVWASTFIAMFVAALLVAAFFIVGLLVGRISRLLLRPQMESQVALSDVEEGEVVE